MTRWGVTLFVLTWIGYISVIVRLTRGLSDPWGAVAWRVRSLQAR